MFNLICAAAFAVFPETCVTPDGMALDAQDRLVVAAANLADPRMPGAVFRLDNPGERPYKWFDVPVNPRTGRASPMGLAFGPDGALYVVDNQPWTGEALTKNQGRLLRLTFRDDRVASCDVIAEGLEHPNGVAFHRGKLYLTQSALAPLGAKPGAFASGVYRFDPADRNVRVANDASDPNLLLTVRTRNRFCPYGLDGLAFDAAGALYLGNFGDGEILKVTFDAAGKVASRTVFAKTPFDTARDPASKGFLAYAASCPLRTTDGMRFGPDGALYVADFSNNAIVRVSPDGRDVRFVRRDPDGSHAVGGLNQPGEPIFWRGRLIASNFDAVCANPDKVNARRETPATLTLVAEPVFGTPRAVPGGAGRGMALALDGKTLYAGLDGRVAVFDVSAPLAPRKLGEVDGLGGVRQLAAQNGFVYATARESGFWIVDATDPAHPRIRSRFDSCELATGVDVAGAVAFVGQRQNGVEFIDVSDPDHPAHIAMRQTDESQSVLYRDGFLYSGDWGSGRLTVFDARDMRAIRQVAYEPLWGFGDGVWKKGRYLYAATGHHSKNRDVKTLPFKPVDNEDARTFGMQPGSGCGHGLDIFDVSDPTRPRRTGRADFPPLFVRGLDMWTPRTSANAEMVFCAQTHNGLFAVDCTDKAHPRVADRWCFPEPKHPEWPSTCLGSVAVGDGCVYVVGQACGLRVIPARGAAAETVEKGAPPAHPEFREPYPTDARAFYVWKADRPGQARAVALRGDVVYAACGDAGLHVLKIRPEGGFAHLGALPNAPTVFDVQVEDDRLYTAEGLAGWACYELTGPASFREVRRRAWYDRARDPALCVWKPAPDRIVLSTRRNGANVFAADDWTSPKSRVLARASNCPGWDKYLMDAPIGGGRWLAYNSAHHWITWIDLIDNKTVKTTPANRTSLSCGLCRLTDDLALMTRDGGYCLLKPGELDPPGGGAWPLHAFPGGRMSGMPRVSKGGRLILTNRINREIGLWDFADIARPKFIRRWKVSGNPDIAVFHNEKFIVPCGHQGVLLQK